MSGPSDRPGSSARKGGRIPNELLLKVKQAVNLVEVIGRQVVLRKSGANHSGLCPFHAERTPSFSVNETKQLYHCYGCKRGGDVFEFVKELHGISFREAFEELAEEAKIPLPSDWDGEDSSDPETQKRRAAAREKLSKAYRLNLFSAAFFHENVARLPQFKSYFDQRGVNAELKRSFYVGAAPHSWDALTNHLIARKAPLDLAVELGLIQPSPKTSGPGYFDLFRNRAMFPIFDTRGKVVGFGGRTMPAPDKSAAEEGPKYLNSRESLLFQKSKIAFGLFQAQKHIREKNEVILVEGYFDVLALHAAGFQNVVATCGTSLTPEHLQLFRRFAEKVTVLFDGDKAGITATGRAMELGLEHGQVLYGAVMPAGLDPDEVLFDLSTGALKSDGREQMSSILTAAKPLLDTRINDAVQYAAQGPEQKTRAIKQVAQWLASFSDPVGREVRCQSFQSRLEIDRKLLDQAMGRPVSAGPVASPKPAAIITPANRTQSGTRPSATRKIARSEQILLCGLLHRGFASGVFARVQPNLPKGKSLQDLFEHPDLKKLVQRFSIDTPKIDTSDADFQSCLEQLEDPAAKAFVTATLVEEEPRFNDEEIKVAVERSLGRLWAHFSQQIKAAMVEAETKKDAELQRVLMQEYLDVQRKLKEFSSFYDEA